VIGLETARAGAPEAGHGRPVFFPPNLTLRETAPRLRTALRPGGLLPQDDCLGQGVSVPMPGVDATREREATMAAPCASGGLVLGERLAPKASACAQNARDLDGLVALAGRAVRLA
jgi:hypothetical protein